MLALTLRILFIIVVVLFGCSCAVIRMGPQIESLEEVVVEEGSGDSKMLLIDIDGPISNRPKKTLFGFQSETGLVDRIREILKKAEKDKNKDSKVD